MKQPEKIAFSIIGSEIDSEDGLQFDKFSTIISSYQKIITGVYLAHIGEDRLRRDIRSDFNFTLKNLREGSIEFDVLVHAMGMAQATIADGPDSFYTVSKIMEITVQFLREKMFYWVTHGKNPQVIQVNDKGILHVEINNNSGTIKVSPNIVLTGDKIEGALVQATSVVDGKGIE